MKGILVCTYCAITFVVNFLRKLGSEQMPAKYTGYLKECRMAYGIRLVSVSSSTLVLGTHISIRFILYRIYIAMIVKGHH
jgi:hypothetical protein